MEKSTETVKSFMIAWKLQDYEKMHELCQKTYKVGHTKNQLKALLPTRIKSYRILGTQEITEVMHDVEVSITLNGKSRKCTVRTICETAPFKPSVEGEWGVNPISIKRMV